MSEDQTTKAPDEQPDWIRELERQVPLDPSDPETLRAACEAWGEQYRELAEARGQQDLRLSEEVQQFLALTESLAIAAEGNGLDSTPLVEFYQRARSFYFGLQPRLPAAGPQVLVLLDRLRLRLAGAEPATPPTPAAPPPPAPTPATPGEDPAAEQPETPDAQPDVLDLAAGQRPVPPAPPDPGGVGAAQARERPTADEGTFEVRWGGKRCFLGNTMAFKLFAHLCRRPGHY
jgi:hypothetical protein